MAKEEVWSDVPVAQIDPIFNSQLNQFKETARRMYISTLAGDESGETGTCNASSDRQRKWQMPNPWTWNLSLFNISGGDSSIKGAFDRSRANSLYTRALLKGRRLDDGDLAQPGEGRTSDCQAEKIQIDYLAIQERAFRLRHSTSIRCSMHAAVRRRGHSTWNDATDENAYLTDLGGGQGLAQSVSGPVGGIFTTLLRYVYLTISGGYNEGSVDVGS